MPPANLQGRRLPIVEIAPGTLLNRIHLTSMGALHFGSHSDPARRQRWDAPDASYGVSYFATDGHIAFAETLLRDLSMDWVHEADIDARSLNLVEVIAPIRLVDMGGSGLRRLGADASVVHASYDLTQMWSAALFAHPDQPDGIRYRARHDDSGFSIALFDRGAVAVRAGVSIPLNDPSLAIELARWLDRYNVGLTS